MTPQAPLDAIDDAPAFDASRMTPTAAWQLACRVGIAQIAPPIASSRRDPPRTAHARDLHLFDHGAGAFIRDNAPPPEVASTLRGTFGLAAAFKRSYGSNAFFNGRHSAPLRLAELFGFAPAELSAHGLYWLPSAIDAYPELGTILFRGSSQRALADCARGNQSHLLAGALGAHFAHNGCTPADEPFKRAALANVHESKALEQWLGLLCDALLPDWIPEPSDLPGPYPISADASDKIFSKLIVARSREARADSEAPYERVKADSWRAAILCWDKLKALGARCSREDHLSCGPRPRSAGHGLLLSEAFACHARGEAVAERLGYAGLKESNTAVELFGERAAGLRPAIEALGGSPEGSTPFDLPAGILNRWLCAGADSGYWPQALAELARARARLRPFQDGESGDRTMSLAARFANALPGMPAPGLAAQIAAIGVDPLEIPAAGRCLLSLSMKSSVRDECLPGIARAFAFGAGAGLAPDQMAASRDADGSGPMHWAVRALSPAAIALFADLGADPNARDHLGRSAAHWLSNKSSKTWDADLAGLARALAAAGADFSLPDAAGSTPARLMAPSAPQQALQACLEIHPDALSQKAADGQTALDDLAARGSQWLSLGERVAMSDSSAPPAEEPEAPRRRKAL